MNDPGYTATVMGVHSPPDHEQLSVPLTELPPRRIPRRPGSRPRDGMRPVIKKYVLGTKARVVRDALQARRATDPGHRSLFKLRNKLAHPKPGFYPAPSPNPGRIRGEPPATEGRPVHRRGRACCCDPHQACVSGRPSGWLGRGDLAWQARSRALSARRVVEHCLRAARDGARAANRNAAFLTPEFGIPQVGD